MAMNPLYLGSDDLTMVGLHNAINLGRVIQQRQQNALLPGLGGQMYPGMSMPSIGLQNQSLLQEPMVPTASAAASLGMSLSSLPMNANSGAFLNSTGSFGAVAPGNSAASLPPSVTFPDQTRGSTNSRGAIDKRSLPKAKDL